MIENAKFSGYYFYANLNIYADFQICISVPLIVSILELFTRKVCTFLKK